MVASFKDYPINFLIIGLVIVCMFTFAGLIAVKYDKPASIMDTGYIDISRVQAQMNQTTGDAEAWGNAFRSDNPFVSFGSLILFSIWGVLKLMWTAVMSFLVIYLDIVSGLLHIPPMVVATITAILIISMIAMGWRMIKQGQ